VAGFQVATSGRFWVATEDDCPERRRHGAIAAVQKKSDGALLIAASIIAAVRLNKHEIKPSPALTAKVADSIKLARNYSARFVEMDFSLATRGSAYQLCRETISESFSDR